MPKAKKTDIAAKPPSLGPTTKPLDPIAAEVLARLTRQGTPELNELARKAGELVRGGYAERADAPPAIFLTQRMQICMRHVDFLIRHATAVEKAGDLKRACEIWDDTSDPGSLWNFLGDPQSGISPLSPEVIKQVYDAIVKYSEEIYHSSVPSILRSIAGLAKELGVPFEGLDSFQGRVLEAASAAKMLTARETTARPKAKPRQGRLAPGHQPQSESGRPKFRERAGEALKLSPPEFIKIAYAAERATGTLHKGLIHREDPGLYTDLHNWLRDPQNRMPDDLDLPTYHEWNTRRRADPATQEAIRLQEVERGRKRREGETQRPPGRPRKVDKQAMAG